jgi:hypothetical protein
MTPNSRIGSNAFPAPRTKVQNLPPPGFAALEENVFDNDLRPAHLDFHKIG